MVEKSALSSAMEKSTNCHTSQTHQTSVFCVYLGSEGPDWQTDGQMLAQAVCIIQDSGKMCVHMGIETAPFQPVENFLMRPWKWAWWHNLYHFLGVIQQMTNWWLMIFFIFFPENRTWHFMQIVSTGDNLHEMSHRVSWEKKEKDFKMLSAEIFPRVLCVKHAKFTYAQ